MTSYGGQAVIEGVMMKSDDEYAVACRNPEGKIVLMKEKFTSISENLKWLKLPFIRGIINLYEMLILGFKALTYSSNIAVEEEENISGWYMALSIVIAVAFALFLFKFVPLFLSNTINNFFGMQGSIMLSIIDGIIKIGIFFLYVFVISFWKDIKRTFEYHGAEHMSVHCHEAKKKLTVNNVKRYTTIHRRCGTSFIMIVLIISIIIYSFIPNSVSIMWKFLLRILLLPVIAGISYEILKLSAKYPKNIILNLFTVPGMWFQRLTTRRPDEDQIKVAIKALKAVVR